MRLFTSQTEENTKALSEERDVIVRAADKARKDLNELYDQHNIAIATLPVLYEQEKKTLVDEIEALKNQKELITRELAPMEQSVLLRAEQVARRELEVEERAKVVAMSEKSLSGQYEHCRKLLEDVSDRLQRADEREAKLKEQEKNALARTVYLANEEKRIQELSTQKLGELDKREAVLADAWKRVGDERAAIDAEHSAVESNKEALKLKEKRLQDRERRLRNNLKK